MARDEPHGVHDGRGCVVTGVAAAAPGLVRDPPVGATAVPHGMFSSTARRGAHRCAQ